MKNILLICENKKSAEQIISVINDSEIANVTVCPDISQAQSMFCSNVFHCVVINSPDYTQNHIEFCKYVTGKTAVPIIALIKNISDYEKKLRAASVFIIRKPFSVQSFKDIILNCFSLNLRMIEYEKEESKLMAKLSDLKTISHAKCLLVEKMAISEENAHKFIEKRAMDMRISKAAVSKMIIEQFAV